MLQHVHGVQCLRLGVQCSTRRLFQWTIDLLCLVLSKKIREEVPCPRVKLPPLLLVSNERGMEMGKPSPVLL